MTAPAAKIITPRSWPTLPLPQTREEAQALIARLGGEEKFQEWLQKREQLIDLEIADPFNYGYEPQEWRDADALLKEVDILVIMGGNRSTKSEFAAKRSVQVVHRKNGARVWGLQTSEPNSIAMQQPRVWKYLPSEWRNLRKTRITNISYTQKNGFSEGTFVAPNTSQYWFKNYMQDVSVVEGEELDFVWCDELVTMEWVSTLMHRITTRAGKMVITFTPVQGYSQTVGEFMGGARVVKWMDSPLLPDTINFQGGARGKVPYIMRCGTRYSNAAIIFFPTSCNPYHNYEQTVKMLRGKSSVEILERAYGLATKLIGNVFGRFGEEHIVSRDRLPKEGTRYCVADGAGVKNWFIKWYLVAPDGKIFTYREWPDYQHFGEWALPGERPEGKPGPAQRAGGGRGIDDYKRIILEAEGWVYDEEKKEWDGSNAEPIYQRIIDPRFGSAIVPSDEGGTSVIWYMEQEKLEGDKVILPALHWTEPPGLKVDERVQLINQKLDWNPEQPLSLFNCPQFYVVEDCRQSIFALQEYKGVGEKEFTKDVIDCDGYLLAAGPDYVDDAAPVCVGGGSY